MRPTVIKLALAAACAFAVAAAPEAQQAEPPLEFTIEVDGQSVDARAEEPAKVRVNGRDVTATVKVKPTKLLQTPEFSFRYPRQHAFAYESDESTTTWTLDGNDSVVILTRYAAKIPPADLAPALIKEIGGQLGEVKQSPASIELFGKKVDGTRLAATLAGQKIVQAIYTFDVAGVSYSLVLQDSSGEETAGAEPRAVAELLTQSAKAK